jgi:hypothetical protein
MDFNVDGFTDDEIEKVNELIVSIRKKNNVFGSAMNDVDNLIDNLREINEKLNRHETLIDYDWQCCFDYFEGSRMNGALHEVTLIGEV